MATGVLIAEEHRRPPATLDAVPLTVHKLERVTPDNISAEQREAGIPPDWTLLHIEVADEDAPRRSPTRSAQVLGDFGWYADLQAADEVFVDLHGQACSATRGATRPGARRRSSTGGRVACPSAQLDWP